MSKGCFERLENEQKELERKISKLELFMISDEFEKLCDLQKSLLMQQYNAMCSYNNVLCLRIRIVNPDLVGTNDERLNNQEEEWD